MNFPSGLKSDFKNFMNRVSGKLKTRPEKLPSSTLNFLSSRALKQDRVHDCPEYMSLKRDFRDIGRMYGVIEILGRDFLTAMPQGAYKARLSQIAFLYRRVHEDLSSPVIKAFLDTAKEHEYTHPEKWEEADSANLREMTNLYLMYCSVDPKLMEKKARLSYEGRKRHNDIKKTGDWETAKVFLKEQIDLHREIAKARCAATNEDSLYQMLIQEYMPSMTVFEIENLFSQHEEAVNEMLPQIVKRQAKQPEPLPLEEIYDPEAQMWLNRSMLEVIGFDFARGGLYETGHNPVEGGTPEDTRLVIYNVGESDFMHSLRSALHEGGHGLYIQGLPRQEWSYQPVAMDVGAAVHESQALLFEMILCRMPEFYEFLSPRLEGLFQGMHSPALAPDNLFALRTRVKATTERRSADEVTYFYHVLLRFRLERDLIEGDLSIDDLPQAWSDGMYELLGVRPKSHVDGCLQDVHWFVGKFGYFPSYAVGHMMAAQMYNALSKDIDDIPGKVQDGEFGEIKDWLVEKVYSKGRLYNTRDLLKDVTGQKLRADYLAKHLRGRYLS